MFTSQHTLRLLCSSKSSLVHFVLMFTKPSLKNIHGIRSVVENVEDGSTKRRTAN